MQSSQGIFLATAQRIESRLRPQRLQTQDCAIGALRGMTQETFLYRMQPPCLRAQVRTEIGTIGHQQFGRDRRRRCAQIGGEIGE